MSTSIKNLRQLAARDVKDHTAIFDSYVVLGRDIDYLAIKFGLDPENIVNFCYQQPGLSAGRLRGADSKTEAPGGRRGRSSMRG